MTSTVNSCETVYSFTADGNEPDFTVRSGEDKNTIFHVQRSALATGSQVFKDMFYTCDPMDSTAWVDVSDLASSKESLKTVSVSTPTESMEMIEGVDVLQMLFRVLHDAPVPLPSAKEMSKWEKQPAYYKEYKASEAGADQGKKALQPPIASSNAVPLPLLRKLFTLADKYDFSPGLISTLQTHLVAHSFEEPLEVYGLSYTLGFDDVATFASTQLHSPPLDTYHPDTLARILPNIQSLQKLYILHAERKRLLRDILSEEPLYPSGYGKCTTRKHADALEEAWRKQKRFVLSMDRVHSGTDIAAEMSSILQDFSHCETCRGRINAVTQLLQVRNFITFWKLN